MAVGLVVAGCGSGQASSGGAASRHGSLAGCIAAWNASSSVSAASGLSVKVDLDITVTQNQPPSPRAVLATYSGPDEDVVDGNGQHARVSAGQCLLVADSAVFVQQAGGSWVRFRGGPGTPFVGIAVDLPTWTQKHSNVTVVSTLSRHPRPTREPSRNRKVT